MLHCCRAFPQLEIKSIPNTSPNPPHARYVLFVSSAPFAAAVPLVLFTTAQLLSSAKELPLASSPSAQSDGRGCAGVNSRWSTSVM